MKRSEKNISPPPGVGCPIKLWVEHSTVCGVGCPINSDVNSDVIVAGVKARRMFQLPTLELSFLFFYSESQRRHS